MDYIVGAYVAAPPASPWRPDAEAAFLAGVAEIDRLGGLELPFLGAGLHAHDESWLFRHLPPGGRHVVTAVPATVVNARDNPRFGLASTDETARGEALRVLAGVRDAVERLAQHEARAAVVAVEVQSAPPGTAGTPAGTADQFARSLTQLAGWDWSGARLVVEHCDAAGGPHRPEKGFLPLAAEIEAVTRANDETGAAIGLSVNWARSVIERRDPAAAPDHVRQLADAGLLAGIVFSGVASVPREPFPAWCDAHLPPQPMEPVSLLAADAIAATFAAAGGSALDFAGVKIGARTTDVTPQDRADGIRLALDMVAAAHRRTAG